MILWLNLNKLGEDVWGEFGWFARYETTGAPLEKQPGDGASEAAEQRAEPRRGAAFPPLFKRGKAAIFP